MSYYIVAKGTGHIVTDGPNRTRAYKTFGAARATRTRLCNKAGWSVSDLTIIATKHYQPRTKTVKNLMTGQPVEIDVNTPRACDPSSELYWSM
jgi:hypothetical protein